MKSFWDKAIEKHRKGKGIKARTNRGPKLKATAKYGGMAERQIQMNLELHLEPILTNQKSIINPEKDLSIFIEIISDFGWVEISQDVVEEFERNMKGLEIKEFQKIFSRQRIATVGITI